MDFLRESIYFLIKIWPALIGTLIIGSVVFLKYTGLWPRWLEVDYWLKKFNL